MEPQIEKSGQEPGGRRYPGKSTLALGALSWVLGFSAAQAHVVDPVFLPMRPGGQDYIYVADVFQCPAFIKAVSRDTSAVTVYALDMVTSELIPGDGMTATVSDRIDQVFVVIADSMITTTQFDTIEVCWDGDDPSGCFENNCSPYAPFIVEIEVRPDPKTDGANDLPTRARDPVSLASLEFVLPPWSLLSLGGPADMKFAIQYASALSSDGNVTSTLGPNWSHNFDWRLNEFGHSVEIVTPRGRVIRFEKGFFDSEWTLGPYADVPFQLVDDGGGYRLGDPRDGRVYTFNGFGQLVMIEAGDNTLVLSHAGTLSQVTDNLGRVLTMGYGGGRLTSVSDGTRTVSMSYTNSILTSVTDAMGGVTAYAYEPGSALMTARTLPRGNTPYTQAYDENGTVTSQTDAFGNTFTFSRDAVLDETTVTDPLGNTTVYGFGASGELAVFQDPDAQTAWLTNDETGRRTEVIDRLGKATSWTYHDPSGKVEAMTEADGSVTTYAYTPRVCGGITLHDLTGIAYPDGGSSMFVYDAAGNVLQWTDPLGNQWSAIYNGSGQPLMVTNPEGGVTTLTYNPDWTRASTTDPAGNTTTYGYDTLRRMNSVTYADGSSLSFTHNDLDRVVSATDELGNTTAYTHDANGNLISIHTPLSRAWNLAYDAMDRLTAFTDPLLHATNASYNETGNLETITDPNGNTRTLLYDAVGRVISHRDPAGNAWPRTYDQEWVPASRGDPLSHVLAWTSDDRGRVTAVRSPLGNQIGYVYDAMGRLIRIVDPRGTATDITYDLAGLPSEISAAGTSVSFTRNGLGLPEIVTDPRGNTRQRIYDGGGRELSLTDPLGNQEHYDYDPRNQLARITYPGTLGTVDVTRDPAGHVVRQLYSDGTDLSSSYDGDGRMTGKDSITVAYDDADRMIACNGLTATYDAGGRMTGLTLAPGKSITYSWNSRDLLTAVSDWDGRTTTFEYDGALRLTSITRSNGVTTALTYDDDNELIGLQEGAVSDIALTRNAAGRIVEAVRTVPLAAVPETGLQALTYDEASQIAGYLYDELGRLLDDGTCVFTWDLASRLVGLERGVNTVSFIHDGAGNVVRRTESAVTRHFVWNYMFQLPVISVVREGGSDLRYYVHTPDGTRLLYSIDAATGAPRFFHYDEVGNTLFLTDETGGVTDAYAYGPFGCVLARTGSTENPFTFHGRFSVLDEGDLFLMRARPYDARTGRFIARDPVEGFGLLSVNPYQAFFNNPLAFVDPSGTTPPDSPPPYEDFYDEELVHRKKQEFITEWEADIVPHLQAQNGLSETERLSRALADFDYWHREYLQDLKRKTDMWFLRRETSEDRPLPERPNNPMNCRWIIKKFRKEVLVPATKRLQEFSRNPNPDGEDLEKRILEWLEAKRPR